VLADPGPSWTDILTAIGTVGATVVALVAAGVAIWIAIWSDRRTDKRLADERKAADARLADERKAADDRLRLELDHSAAQLQMQLLEAQRQEQLAQAYVVQVTNMRTIAFKEPGDESDEPLERATVVVVNHGRYTITRLDARLFEAGSIASYSKTRFVSSFVNIPAQFAGKGAWEPQGISSTSLTPMDVGMEWSTGRVAKKFLVGSYPIVRWQDHWGAWWEHKKGVVREIEDGAPWEP
jgi:hypothetical protein